jgi:type IV fimbrial biogenesis protein FimT
LVELMVSLAVLAILVAMAVPSFVDFAQRSALRGAADNIVSVIGAARQEATKRDSLVNVQFKAVSSGFCVGAVEVANVSDAGCDCSSASCAVGQYPSGQGELRSVTMSGTPTFGTDTAFVIDPKTGTLSDINDSGSIQLTVPRGYGVAVQVNALGRASLCTPSGKKALSGVGACP